MQENDLRFNFGSIKWCIRFDLIQWSLKYLLFIQMKNIFSNMHTNEHRTHCAFMTKKLFTLILSCSIAAVVVVVVSFIILVHQSHEWFVSFSVDLHLNICRIDFNWSKRIWAYMNVRFHAERERISYENRFGLSIYFKVSWLPRRRRQINALRRQLQIWKYFHLQIFWVSAFGWRWWISILFFKSMKRVAAV